MAKSIIMGFPDGTVVKNPPGNAGDARDAVLILGLGRFPGISDNLLQYSCLENSMDRGVWQTMVQGVTKSLVWLSDITHIIKNNNDGTSLAVQGLRLCAANAREVGSIPGGGAKIPHAVTIK